MSYIASHIATVPSGGFRWYLIFLEGSLSDPVKEEIDKQFFDLGRRAGRNIVAVRGYDPDSFRESVYELNPEWEEQARFPALLVTNKSPAAAAKEAQSVEDSRTFLFSLEPIYNEDRTLAKFLVKLLETLNDPASIEGLERMEKRQLRRERWGWLNRWLMLEPNISGFGVRGNQVLSDIADL